MDARQRLTFIEKIKEEEEFKHNRLRLDIAECINFAYVASQPNKKGANDGSKNYVKWRKDIVKKMYPDYQELTIWDRRKKNKSLKF